jgi:hypothetical protein
MAQQNLFFPSPRTRCCGVLVGIDYFWPANDVFLKVG